MFSFLGFGSRSPKVGSQDLTAESVSSSASEKKATGEREDGISVQQVPTSGHSDSASTKLFVSPHANLIDRIKAEVYEGTGLDDTWKDVPDIVSASPKKMEHLGFNLETFDHFPGHLEITGSSDGKIICNQFHEDHHDQAPSIFQRGYRAMMRNQTQRDGYRRGIENVKSLLLDKYDQNAVDRFDKHFSYRMWSGKPLTVRALENFIDEEDDFRRETLNISNVEENKKPATLEGLKTELGGAGSSRDSRLVIGGSKEKASPREQKREVTPFFPIVRSWFESAANVEDIRKGDADGIAGSLKMILDLLPKDETHMREHVENLFNISFADQLKTGKPLKVKDLSSFVDKAIQIRNAESGVLGPLRILMEEVSEEGADVAAVVGKFVKGSYHALGVLAGASIILDQTRNTSDPIALVLKGIFSTGVVASETDTQRILTAAMLHYVGSSPATQASWTSRIAKIFIPFY
ncbi:MAG: hypothetical protein K2W97_00500 [Chthoniobacterales bacterium]|nr:hypothetical protein [Chthoniobacterales bacterium]